MPGPKQGRVRPGKDDVQAIGNTPHQSPGVGFPDRTNAAGTEQ